VYLRNSRGVENYIVVNFSLALLVYFLLFEGPLLGHALLFHLFRLPLRDHHHELLRFGFGLCLSVALLILIERGCDCFSHLGIVSSALLARARLICLSLWLRLPCLLALVIVAAKNALKEALFLRWGVRLLLDLLGLCLGSNSYGLSTQS